MSVYLITGASSDVGTALIDRLYREGDVFIAQGAGDLSHLAPVKLCKTFLPAMAKARQGRVLFMLTSYLLGVPPKNTAAYVMVKSTLQGLAKSLAADYASFGVTVNCVMPSMMETKFLADTSDLIVQASAEANPMKRNARVEDVVPAMAFLLSEEAGFITGVTLPITGGSAFL